MSSITFALPRAAPTALAVLLSVTPITGARPAGAQEEADTVPTVQEGRDFRVYDRNGRPAALSDVIAAAGASEVLLVGEEHDDMPGHVVESMLFDGAIATLEGTGRGVVLSLEMFERDVQYVVDEYLGDLITEAHFLRSARPWDDYDARYRALVESAKANGSPVVAANAPRRYVNRVTRLGPESLETLPAEARRFLPPLPYPGPSAVYLDQWNALMAEAMAEQEGEPGNEEAAEAEPDPSHPAAADSAGPRHAPVADTTVRHTPVADAMPRHTPPDDATHADVAGADRRFTEASGAVYSQALWDASMGHSITTALVEHLGSLVVHFAGSFHVAQGTGIPERIEDYRPGTRVTTVVMTKAADVGAWSEEEHGGLADFVILTQQPAEDEGETGSR